MADESVLKNRLVPQNTFAAALTLVAGAAAATAVLRLEPFASSGFIALVVYLFPVPVACGLAVGLVSPRKAILWAPVYAGILTVIAILVLVGGAESVRALSGTTRLTLAAVGITLGAFSAIVGEKAAEHGWAGKSAAMLAAGCVAVVILGRLVVGYEARVFERSVLPQVLLHIDSDYIGLPAGIDWRCARNVRLGCYEIVGKVRGRDVRILAAPTDPRVLGVRFDIGGGGASIGDLKSARRCLDTLGFRKKLLGSLSQRKGAGTSWCAGLEVTRLTLDADGHVRVEDV